MKQNQPTDLLDTDFLEAAEVEIDCVADTHFIQPGMRGAEEFPSRGKQTERAALALRFFGSADFGIHLGDLVQEYPEMEGFQEIYEKALSRLEAGSGEVHLVAGNHDVGDKPDTTMPTHPVEPEMLAWFHQRMGKSWKCIEKGNCAFFIINSQILNTGLPEEEEQRQWLEQTLESLPEKRKFLFHHLPLYLDEPGEPAKGHYDVISDPARGWLLELIKKHHFEFSAGAHVHFSFFDRIGACRYFQMASTSFTRPGFGFLFHAPSASEQGRNDTGKLGFYRIRVLSDRTDVHFIRTYGDPDSFSPPEGFRPLLTRLSAGLPHSPLALSLIQPLSSRADVPVVFPSVLRHSVRNDYPLLVSQELGARHLRIPEGDLRRENQVERLRYLLQEGLHYQVFGFDPEILISQGLESPLGKPPDALEWQLEGTDLPDLERLHSLNKSLRGSGISLVLSPVVPGVMIPGKQHPRTRIGYDDSALNALSEHLKEADLKVDRVLFRIASDRSALDQLPSMVSLSERPFEGLDFLMPFESLDDLVNGRRALEAMVAIAPYQGSRLFLEPMNDMDRTMDVTHGLLNGHCNPRPVFPLLRSLNTLLFSRPDRPAIQQEDSDHVQLTWSSGEKALLALKGRTGKLSAWLDQQTGISEWSLVQLNPGYRALGGTTEIKNHLKSGLLEGPLFLQSSSESSS